MRVVVYAEGGRDLGESTGVAPSHPIPEELLGPAHNLVRRALARDGVSFEAPLRSPTGRRLKSSDFLVEKRLRRALTWPSPQARPDLGVVLVDADGDNHRLRRLSEIVEGRRQRVAVVLGVAVQSSRRGCSRTTRACSGPFPRGSTRPPSSRRWLPARPSASWRGGWERRWMTPR